LSRTVPGCPGEACPASPGNLEILKISFFGHLWSSLVTFGHLQSLSENGSRLFRRPAAASGHRQNARKFETGCGGSRTTSRAPGFSDTLSPVPVPHRINLFNPYPKSLQ